MKVLFVFGTRPEAIKLAPVINEAKSQEGISTVVVVTGQHREMLDQVLNLFGIIPDYDLEIMLPRQELFDVVTRALVRLKPILEKERPDIVLVQGDTTTTFTATLAAFYLKIPIGHIEAGLRTFDKYQPFPEEANRRLTSHLADYHFAPTEEACKNLRKEGIFEDSIYVTGNTVIDALLYTVDKNNGFSHPILNKLDYSKKIITITGHRRENWGKPLENVCRALQQVIRKYPEVRIIFSVHLNPRVQEIVRGILAENKKVHLIEPLDYESFVQLMSKSYILLTDSGGIQEEAPSLGKPVLVLRDKTERPEAIKAGVAKLTGTSVQGITQAVGSLLSDREHYRRMARAVNPYGDGQASKRIIKSLRLIFNYGEKGSGGDRDVS